MYLRAITTYLSLACALLLTGAPAFAGVVLDDPLQGSTVGTREGGTFVAGGWKVTGKNDCIYWHIPTISKGAYEYDVRGLNPNECRAGMEDKAELSHMYDYTWYNSDVQYGDPGYRNNPYKHFVRKTGCLGSYNNTIDSCELLWATPLGYVEPDTPVLNWNPATTYRIRVEWGTDGAGNAVLKWFRDGVLYLTTSVPGTYAPTGHSFRIAASPRRAADAGAPIDAIFSNVKVWDLNYYTPSPPTVTLPANGATNRSNLVYIAWNGEPHTDYQVRICLADNPEAVAWDSGEVASSRSFAWTGALSDLTNHYVYVRIGNTGAWSDWSAAGPWFRVDSSYASGSNNVRLSGRSFEDANGPFIGLGFTYMASMWFCKNNRTQYQDDLAFMSARGFNYQRILSEVPGADSSDYWWGRSINASTYQCQHGTWASPWPDYDQQLRDCIDIAYDQYGIRTEITIFGGAGESFPTYAGRQAHCQRVLNNLAGREHKILLIEVANEAWQTGFPGEQGRLDLRSLGQYLADRTSIPIALTAMCTSEATQSSLVNLYSGSAADITTEHFERYLNGPEGHWFPVRDPWRAVDVPGLPPVSSNEPVGPGSSVASEDDPIHIASAAAFAWIANLNSYVYHTRAGVRRDVAFQAMAGVNDLVHLREILPPDTSSWIRNDGKQSTAPFTAYCMGQANKYWTDVAGATDGCHRNIGGRKGNEFVCYPQGILSGGLTLVAREKLTFSVYHPLTGEVVVPTITRNQGEQLFLSQGPEAYIIKGVFGDGMGPTNEVSIDLGSPDVTNCMTHVPNADGDTQPVSIGGRSCRRNLDPSEDFYFYFGVCDSFAYQGSKLDLYIIIEYYDTGTSTLALDYDSNTGTGIEACYRNGGSVTLTNTNTWKSKSFHVTDAWFGNRQNAGADFRISDIGPVFYLDKVRVTTEPPLAPVIAEVTPDPAIIQPETAYTQQLSLVEGSPAPSWSVVQAPAGVQVSAAGLVSGWTPGPADFGSFVFEIEAANSEGTDTESWVVQVVSSCDFDVDGDVDQADFGHFQRCFSGDGLPYVDGCEAADLQVDGDVDQGDFTLFRPCMAGADQPPGC